MNEIFLHSKQISDAFEIDPHAHCDSVLPNGVRVEFKESAPRKNIIKEKTGQPRVYMRHVYIVSKKDYSYSDFVVFCDSEMSAYYIVPSISLRQELSKRDFKKYTSISISKIQKIKSNAAGSIEELKKMLEGLD